MSESMSQSVSQSVRQRVNGRVSEGVSVCAGGGSARLCAHACMCVCV